MRLFLVFVRASPPEWFPRFFLGLFFADADITKLVSIELLELTALTVTIRPITKHRPQSPEQNTTRSVWLID